MVVISGCSSISFVVFVEVVIVVVMSGGLIDVMTDMAASATDRREMGPIAAKFVENLQRSNEQMVKLASILQRQKTNQIGLTDDDKEQLFDLLNEEK